MANIFPADTSAAPGAAIAAAHAATAARHGPAATALALAGALSLAVAMGIGRFAFTPMLPLMIREGGIDVGWGGWIAAANYAGYLVGALTAARMPLPPIRLALAALLLTAVLTAAMAVPAPAGVWLVLRLAAGACSAWAFVGTSVWCLGALARAGQPGWGGIVYAGVGSGIMLAGLYCLAGAQVSVAGLWLQLGAVALVLIAPVAWVMRRLAASGAAALSSPVVPAASVPPAAPAAAAGPLPQGTHSLVLCYGLLGFGYILPATFLPVLARSIVDDPRLFGLAWPVFGLTAALSTLLAGWWMRRATRLQVWAVSNLLMGVGVLLPSLWLSGLTIALSALLVGGTFMVITLAGVQEMRARAVGDPTRLVGRSTTAFAAGQIAGPLLSAALAHLPVPGVNALNLALQIGAASLLASAAWLWRVNLFSVSRKDISHATH